MRRYAPDPGGELTALPPDLTAGFWGQERKGKRETKGERENKAKRKGSERGKEGSKGEGDKGKGKWKGRNFVQL